MEKFFVMKTIKKTYPFSFVNITNKMQHKTDEKLINYPVTSRLSNTEMGET
jgi:hypothetical protein